MRPTQGPQNIAHTSQRPRSKTNKLYYYQGYHDGSSKYKKKPPKGMYINHDDVLKLAAQDLYQKQKPLPQNDLLLETEREINLLNSQVRHYRLFDATIFINHFFFLSFSMFLKLPLKPCLKHENFTTLISFKLL